MSQMLWEQNEWHGMARRGSATKDPMTSFIELNTEPGSGTLRRILGRRPYLSSRLPIPAARFDDFCGAYVLHSGLSPVTSGLSKQGTAFEAHVCFKFDDYAAIDSTTDAGAEQPVIFGCGSTPDSTNMYWGFWVEKSADDWYLRAEVRDGAASKVLDTTAALASESWYWARLSVSDASATLTYYKDGSTTTAEAAVVDSSLTRPGYSPSGMRTVVGNSSELNHPVYRASIAFASLGNSSAVPTPWSTVFPEQGGDYDCVFRITDPNYTIQPALLEDTTNTHTWQQLPRPTITTTGLSEGSGNPFNARGIESNYARGYVLKTPGLDVFKERTVFMFWANWTSAGTTFIRSYDSTFKIYTSGGTQLQALYPCADPSRGSTVYGRLATASNATALSTSKAWFAVELNPDNSASAANIAFYEYNSPSATWDSLLAAGDTIGHGLLSIDTTEWTLMESPSHTAQNIVYDFRLVVGDDNWTTTYNATAISDHMPSSLMSWLNLDTSSRFPMVSNLGSVTAAESNDLAAPVIGYADRVDGVIRYQVDPYSGQHGFDGCTHLTNGYLARVENFAVDSNGSVSGCTDSYFFEDTTPYPQRQATTKSPRIPIAVGSHKYVAGAAPLQVISDTAKLVGWRRADIESFATGTSESTATVDFGGQLSWSTTYRYKMTHYDPVTGDESNAYGPFRFTTDSAPGSTSVPYGTGGCSFKVDAKIYTMQDLTGQAMRFYRYHSATGRYFLEGVGKVTDYQIDSNDNKPFYEASFTFAKSDDDLLLSGKELELDNDSPPHHSSCFIWNGRAFYTDGYRPSRLWFSKPFQFGSVPGANLLWTDEGSGGNILGYLPGLGGLLVLREHSIWIIPQFNTADQAYIQSLIPDIGCVSGGAAVFAEGILWWASPGGIYSYDGSTMPVNHSERLDGIDWQVWSHAPRETRAYYNKYNWTVVFTCDGSGISIDIRSGAAALVSAPETIAQHANTHAYSGPLFGGDGMIWKYDTYHNDSLQLDSTGGMMQYDRGPDGAGGWTALSWHWEETIAGSIGTSGSVHAGWRFNIDLNGSSARDWLTYTALTGRTFSWYPNTTKDDIWTITIHDSASPRDVFVRTLQEIDGGQSFIGRVPLYYRSQDIYFGRSRDPRIFDRLELMTGPLHHDVPAATASATVLFTTYVAGGNTATVKATGTIDDDESFLVPIRRRGMRSFYEIETSADRDFPTINGVSVHFRVTKARGRQPQ